MGLTRLQSGLGQGHGLIRGPRRGKISFQALSGYWLDLKDGSPHLATGCHLGTTPAPGGCTVPCHMVFSQVASQNCSSLLQRQQGRGSLPQSLIQPITMDVTAHHLCCILSSKISHKPHSLSRGGDYVGYQSLVRVSSWYVYHITSASIKQLYEPFYFLSIEKLQKE